LIAAPKFDPAHLLHAQPSPLRARVERQLLQSDDAVHDAAELKIVALRRHVVDHQHRRMPRPQEVLQREYLSPITQRVLRQQPHLGKRVDDNARRVDALDLTAQQTHRLAELDFEGRNIVCRVSSLSAISGGTSSQISMPSSFNGFLPVSAAI
jgi:hypothetical protein